MKKFFPFIVGAIALVLLLVIMMSSSNAKRERKLDQRITLKQSDKIPYGTKVAKELLPVLFPEANINFTTNHPGNWNDIDRYEPNQAIVLMTDYFFADKRDLEELSEFVEEGNYVFIISRSASDAVASYFNISFKNTYSASYSTTDSLQVKLVAPAFTNTSLYTYPGLKYDAAMYYSDSNIVQVLGRNENGEANFIRLKKGKGSFYIHAAPLAFSNYFILHKSNTAYYQQAISVLPKEISFIYWNEYFLESRDDSDDGKRQPNWLGALLQYPAFKWGLVTAALTLLLFLLLGMRRRQRMIPPVEQPKNDSLDFVKTLGRLYYDKRDHTNLAAKMIAYFLEHVRSRYKLPTHTLDDAFIASLHFKSGYPEEATRDLVTTIHQIRTTYAVSDGQLSAFHKKLEAFYQNT